MLNLFLLKSLKSKISLISRIRWIQLESVKATETFRCLPLTVGSFV